MTRHIHGYAADIPYLRDFKPMLAPAWLDHVALIGGLCPPARHSGFAWCDLGCGQGVTAAILAATHPGGVFHGIDAMRLHIDHGRRLAAEAAIPNLRFHAIDFAGAIGLDLPEFDYIVAHGVYSWIDAASQEALRRFIERHLRPGGLVYLSYNAMPGWARDLPFHGLVREFGRKLPGDSAAQVAFTGELARTLAESGVPALAASFIVKELKERPAEYTPAYLVHEFMPAAWQPLYVTEVRAAMATIDLNPVGSATLSENFDWILLTEQARETLATITDANARELVRDYYLDQRFRCDVFARGNRQLSTEDRAERILSSAFALARPRPAIRYRMDTPAGLFDYDSPAIRDLTAVLAAGRRSLVGLPAELKTVLTLCTGGDIIPVEPRDADVADLNRILCARVDGPEEIGWLALPCGTAVEADRDLLRALRDGDAIGDDRFPGWREFLASHHLQMALH
jgi:SAM-dependent methyltransferase